MEDDYVFYKRISTGQKRVELPRLKRRADQLFTHSMGRWSVLSAENNFAHSFFVFTLIYLVLINAFDNEEEDMRFTRRRHGQKHLYNLYIAMLASVVTGGCIRFFSAHSVL